jgi:hypothetical protein
MYDFILFLVWPVWSLPYLPAAVHLLEQEPYLCHLLSLSEPHTTAGKPAHIYEKTQPSNVIR